MGVRTPRAETEWLPNRLVALEPPFFVFFFHSLAFIVSILLMVALIHDSGKNPRRLFLRRQHPPHPHHRKPPGTRPRGLSPRNPPPFLMRPFVAYPPRRLLLDFCPPSLDARAPTYRAPRGATAFPRCAQLRGGPGAHLPGVAAPVPTDRPLGRAGGADCGGHGMTVPCKDTAQPGASATTGLPASSPRARCLPQAAPPPMTSTDCDCQFLAHPAISDFWAS